MFKRLQLSILRLMEGFRQFLVGLGQGDLSSLSTTKTVPLDPATFSISLLALFAKLAKSDGQISIDEVRCVRSIIMIDPEDERDASKFFDQCGRNSSGFEAYARKIHKAIGRGHEADDLREDVLDALFHVALADGEFHPAKECMIDEVAKVLQIDEFRMSRIKARHLPEAWDPHLILGVTQNASKEELKIAWRCLVKKAHPDAVRARGLPREMIKLSEERMALINLAYAELSRKTEALPVSS
ncbi:molecular chaperone DjiA [Epibacterium sp. DP7N7-1]|nr:molecular chaperone DjiA [Epibacterium sp. DP7N7-1]